MPNILEAENLSSSNFQLDAATATVDIKALDNSKSVGASASMSFQQEIAQVYDVKANGLLRDPAYLEAQGSHIVLNAGRDLNYSDWSAYSTVLVELENQGNSTQKIKLKLTDAVDAKNPGGAVFETTVQPGAQVRWHVPIFHLRYTSGNEWPQERGMGAVTSRGMVDTAKIVALELDTTQPDGIQQVKVTGISLSGQIRPDNWIDRFGQNDTMSYFGKINSEDDLIKADQLEKRSLTSGVRASDRDQYQGWRTENPFKATGFFRTDKVGNRWWLVDPDGQPFYSTGMNCVNSNVSAAVDGVSGRAYSWLPDSTKEFASAISEQGASLYTSNLIRKWGADSATLQSRERAIERNLDWGFTTLGNWSDKELNKNHKLPYVSPGPYIGGLAIPYIDGSLCDVFHPSFEEEANKAATTVSATKDDHWLLGYFVDNELPWTYLTTNVLKAPVDLPARQYLISSLKTKYSDIATLNKSWNTKAESFESLREPDLNQKTDECKKDLAAYRKEFAERFYSVWYDAIKKNDPNHLILGSRLCDRFDEVVEACGRHSDVVSFNFYRKEFDAKEFEHLYKLAGKPFLIGEYAHNSLDSGNLTAAVLVKDQKERGIAYSAYTENVAAQPYFVGSHYFQYVDEPITGRTRDRESAYNGFVAVTDIPYQPLVDYARWTNQRIYSIHNGEIAAFNPNASGK